MLKFTNVKGARAKLKCCRTMRKCVSSFKRNYQNINTTGFVLDGYNPNNSS